MNVFNQLYNKLLWIKTGFKIGPFAEHCITKTRPDEQPIVTTDPATAEQNGRYSDGSHSNFSEHHVIHIPSGLKPYP